MKYLKPFSLNEQNIILSEDKVNLIAEELLKLNNNHFYEKCDDFNMFKDIANINTKYNRFGDFDWIKEKIFNLFGVKNIKYPTIVDSAYFEVGNDISSLKINLSSSNYFSISIYPRKDDWYYISILWDKPSKRIKFKCDQEIGLLTFLKDFKSLIDKHNI